MSQPGGVKNKYGNKATIVDGVRFASKAEARRFGELRLLERAGAISDLKLQPRYPLKVNGQLVCTYVADFSHTEGDQLVVTDVKGVETDVFKIKRKLLKALHNIEIRVVK